MTGPLFFRNGSNEDFLEHGLFIFLEDGLRQVGLLSYTDFFDNSVIAEKTMKNLTIGAIFFICVVGSAFSQNDIAAHGSSAKKPIKTFNGSNLHAINALLGKQIRQIQKDRRRGKITSEQAKDLMEKLKSIRQQELILFKQNGRKEITEVQKNQLEEILDKNANFL